MFWWKIILGAFALFANAVPSIRHSSPSSPLKWNQSFDKIWKLTLKCKKTSSQAPSYASLKQRPSASLTRVKFRGTSVAKKQFFWREFFLDQSWLEKTPPTAFCIFTQFFLNFVQQKIIQLFLRSSDSFVQYFTNSRWKSAEK